MMPLSEYEQRVLEQMERQLASDDPRLANTLMSRRSRPLTRYLVAGVGATLGMLLLVVGVSGSMWWLGVIGFVVMFVAVAYAFASPRRSGPAGIVENGKVRATKARRKPNGRSFMERLEDRWDRRREQGGQ
jgi:Protein of unknown function (DUF3040)